MNKRRSAALLAGPLLLGLIPTAAAAAPAATPEKAQVTSTLDYRPADHRDRWDDRDDRRRYDRRRSDRYYYGRDCWYHDGDRWRRCRRGYRDRYRNCYWRHGERYCYRDRWH